MFFNKAVSKRVKILNKNPVPLKQRSTYGKAFLQLFNLWTQDDIIKQLIFSKRLVHIAIALMQVEGIRLFTTKPYSKKAAAALRLGTAGQYYRLP